MSEREPKLPRLDAALQADVELDPVTWEPELSEPCISLGTTLIEADSEPMIYEPLITTEPEMRIDPEDREQSVNPSSECNLTFEFDETVKLRLKIKQRCPAAEDVVSSGITGPSSQLPFEPDPFVTDPELGRECCDLSTEPVLGHKQLDLTAEPNLWHDPDLHIAIPSILLENEDHEMEVENPDCEEEACVDGDPLIYKGAPITLSESLVSVLTLALSFKLSGACIQSILEVIKLHCPKDKNVFKASIYFFKTYFTHIQGFKDHKYYCSLCFKQTDEKGCKECAGSKTCCLIKLSMIQQLQTLFSRKGFYDKLRSSNESHIPGVYTDIHDGSVYQDQVKMGFLGQPSNISCKMYTDGAALYKSSKVSVWCVFNTINELPYEDRYKKENILVPAIWRGPVKPPGNLLHSACFEELQVLSKGANFNVEGHGEKLVRAMVVTATGDLPARSLMLNMVAHNAAFACHRCEQEGKPRPNYPGVRLFPYQPEEMIPRTPEKMEEYGNLATFTKAYKGSWGPTGFAKICPNFPKAMAVDTMHQCWGGITKKILNLLIKTKHSKEKWSISGKVDMLNEKILSIKPPHHIPRMPRSLAELGHFKMNELKAFCLDYSLPVFLNVLPDNYLAHHACFVAAMQLLSADVVTTQSIQDAKVLLHKYVSSFADFYDEIFLTLNFHLLLHLWEVVECLGPAFLYACFPLENLNGIVLSLVHGTRWAGRQIATSVLTCLGLNDLISKLEDGAAKELCMALMSRTKKRSKDRVGSCYIYGSCQTLPEVSPLILDFILKQNIESAKVLTFPCLKKGKFVYVASSYTRFVARDSTTVVYCDEGSKNVAVLERFIRIYKCVCKHHCNCESEIYAQVRDMKVCKSFPTLVEGITVPNNHGYEETHQVKIISAECLAGVCVKMIFDGEIYVSKPTNTQEIE